MLSLPLFPTLQVVWQEASYTVLLDARQDPSVTVQLGSKTIWRGVKRTWKPWKLVVTDVDANGKPDFAVGLFKSTKYMPKPHNCVFIYGIEGNTVFARWKGSRLDQPFFDFEFVQRKNRKPMMVTVNALLDGKRCLSGYVWNGFGFNKEFQKGSWKSLKIVRVEAPDVVLEADGKEHRVRVD